MSKSTGEENNTEEITRPTKFRKTSSSNYDYTESLPVDVIFEILVRVPAQEIHNSARLVCRKWHNIINTRDFKHAHLHRSTCGLLAHHLDSKTIQQHMTFIASKADNHDDDILIGISKLNYRSPHKVLSSCNGLLLQLAHDNPRIFYITNPATDQKLVLPPFLSNNSTVYGCAMAYVDTTMEYKVVRSVPHYDYKRKSRDDRVAILTVGVDKDWTRRVNTQHLSLQAKKLIIRHPLTTRGFVHWAGDDESFRRGARKESQPRFVLTLNVETEIFSEFPVPHDIGQTELIYLPMGSYLSLLVLRSEFSWELWEMKPETGEWTQMPSIELPEDEFVNSDEKKLKPVGWLRPREVLVFRQVSYFAFNVRTGKLQEFTLDEREKNCFLFHRNSLVWINGNAS